MSTTSITVFLASFGINPVEDTAKDQVDLIEINHFYDERGKHVFDQVLFYDWSAAKLRYNVRAWRLLKKPTQVPVRDVRNRNFVAVWHDWTQGNVLRTVKAQTLRESWTQYDPEMIERKHLPREQRRELFKLINKTAAAN